MNSEKIGKKLREIREYNNLTQEELAAKLDISRDAIIRLEKGTRKLNLEEFKKIIKFYDLDMDSFLNEEKQTNNFKGIILAGGSGTRLYPITEGVSKQLVPVYDKPMIFYPLYVLMLAGIKDILVITTKEDQLSFKKLLKDGSHFGINLSYVIQPSPDGLAEAFILGEDFIGNNPCAMILGDNIYYGSGLEVELKKAIDNANSGLATIFGYQVKDPERFGIMELDKYNNVISVEEKPKVPKSDYAITGLYFYPKGVSELAKTIKPSARGELEITSLNDIYLKTGKLKARLLNDGYTWFDTGTFESLLDASNMIRTIENNRDMLICSPEMVSYSNNWINSDELMERAKVLSKNSYGKQLIRMIEKEKNNE